MKLQPIISASSLEWKSIFWTLNNRTYLCLLHWQISKVFLKHYHGFVQMFKRHNNWVKMENLNMIGTFWILRLRVKIVLRIYFCLVCNLTQSQFPLMKMWTSLEAISLSTTATNNQTKCFSPTELIIQWYHVRPSGSSVYVQLVINHLSYEVISQLPPASFNELYYSFGPECFWFSGL